SPASTGWTPVAGPRAAPVMDVRIVVHLSGEMARRAGLVGRPTPSLLWSLPVTLVAGVPRRGLVLAERGPGPTFRPPFGPAGQPRWDRHPAVPAMVDQHARADRHGRHGQRPTPNPWRSPAVRRARPGR